MIYLWTSRSACLKDHDCCKSENLYTKVMPSPPLPREGFAMKVNLGWSFMYCSSSSLSSGSWKLLGQNLIVFGKVRRMRFTIEQKSFFLANSSSPGYLLKYGIYFRLRIKVSMSFGCKASPNQIKFP